MIIKSILQFIFTIFIFIIPISLVVLVYVDLKELVYKIKNIRKR